MMLISVALVPAGPPGALPPREAGLTAADGWSVGALRAAPLTAVRDTEPGLAVAGAVAVGPAIASSLLIVVSFPIQHPAQLNLFLSSLSDSMSPQYHQYVTAAAFDASYGSNATVYASAASYFQSYDVGALRTSADRLTLTFQATPAQISQIFHTRIEVFEVHGQTYMAPAGSPQLPSPLASAVSGVTGLSTYSILLTHTDSIGAVIRTPPGGDIPAPASPAGYLAPATVNGVQYEYAPDFQHAYDELALFQNAGYPTNEVIATILWSGTNSSGTPVGPYVPSDISAFYNETLPAGQPHPQIRGVPLNGAIGPGPSASYDTSNANFENTLDLEMAGSTAPGASIYNVYGPSSSLANLDAAFAYVLNPTGTAGLANVSVITNSWGGMDYNDTTWFQDLEEAQARGISVLASSGDAGDNPASGKWSGSNVEFPSSMAYNTFGTTAVGGTTVEMALNLALQSQITWNISAADTANSGPVGTSGGVSAIFAEPSWQRDTSANAVISGAGRGTPDIAGIANNTLVTFSTDGYQYRATNASDGQPFESAWGTSIASPLDAGIIAEIDHVLASHGNGALGFLNPQLYALANAEYTSPAIGGTINYDATGNYVSSLPTLPFSDVTAGRNYLYMAQTGYDLVTGWGSIDSYNYTMYLLSVPSSGVYGRLSGVEDSLTLTNLGVTSYFSGGGVNTAYNASIQQNLFLANSLGAPVYWIQNVIYITNSSSGWFMTYSGWVVYPFYGIYPAETLYEYNFPSGQYVILPSTFDVKTVLETPAGFNTQSIAFSVGSHTLTLPVPGAAYMIGSLWYNYSWQGVNYTNGPFPNNPTPGGLSPQFGLVGGPSAATGEFASPTAGNLTARVLPYGGSRFVPADTGSFGSTVDETGEIAANLAWTPQSTENWTLGIHTGRGTQGILSYQPPPSVTTYTVSFRQSGLTGEEWGITINGITHTATTSTITFQEPNGTFDYSVSPVAGWQTASYRGTVTEQGGVQNPDPVTIAFTRILYTVSFSEVGLPSGTAWSVTLNGTTMHSTGSSIGFTEPNGTYPYSVGAISGYSASPSSGNVSVDGTVAGRTITFTVVSSMYAVTLKETGLPSGTSWTVTLGPMSESSTTSSITFNESNGMYPYSIAPIAGYSTQYHGQVTVSNASVSVGLAFTLVEYAVSFTETGLPSGTSWSVTLNGTMHASTSSNISFAEPNGSASYLIGDVQGWHQPTLPYVGTVIIDGAAVALPTLAFASVSYSVTFTETGLPAGTEWPVSLAGPSSPDLVPWITKNSTTPSIVFSGLVNGLYAFMGDSVPGYTADPPSGNFYVAGGSVDVAIAFTLATYEVTFTETGLPSGTAWWVNLTGGASFVSRAAYLLFAEPNGSYTYSVASANTSYTGPGGAFTVDGTRVTEALSFREVTFTLTFTESGLSGATPWYVNITGGSSHSSTSSTLTLNEPNGTYLYTVATGANYETANPSGRVTVAGAPAGVSIAFTSTFGITFNRPAGAAAGTSWTVYLNATTPFAAPRAGGIPPGAAIARTTTASSLTIQAPNGTYSYAIVVAGSPALTSRGSVAVQGSSVVANPTESSPSTFLGFATPTGYYVLAVVIAAILLAIALSLVRIRRRRSGRD